MDWSIKHLYLTLLTRGGKVEKVEVDGETFIVRVRMPGQRVSCLSSIYSRSYIMSFTLTQAG